MTCTFIHKWRAPVLYATVALLSACAGDEDGSTGASDPSTTAGSEATDPGTSEPGTSDPGTSDPGTSDPGTSDPGTSEPGTSEPGTSDPGTSDPGTSDPGTTDPSATDPSETDPSATDPSATDTEGPGDCSLVEGFAGIPDGAPWPAPWVEAGGVEVADVQGERGRLRPQLTSYSLARMFAPLDCVDFEVTFTFMFSDDTTQGVGFYVRQNGGYLHQSDPPGQGYASFTESFRDPAGIGLWREVTGNEENLPPVVPQPIAAAVQYAVRLRVTQQDGFTLLQTRIWPMNQAEPAQWQVERMDSFDALQGTSGGVAIDAWSSLQQGQGTAADLLVDDIVVTPAG
ncbi:MAG: hypothetical protein R3A51_22655 [Nannocystaceae bacterium]